MRKQILVTFLIMTVCIGALAGVKYLQVSAAIAQQSKFQPPPETVTALAVSEVHWADELHSVGTLAPSQGVTLSAEASGSVKEISFSSGDEVQSGALLLQIDASVERAELMGAEALLQDAERNLARIRALRGEKVSSPADLDGALAKAHAAEAAVATLRATIAHKEVRAPFSGRLGIRLINLGQYLTPGTPLVSLHALNPLYLNFSLPQQSIAQVSAGQVVKLSVDAYPERTFEATLTATNPELDPVTRHVKLQATVSNQDESLRAGMFARVRVVLPNKKTYLTVPASSILYAPYGDSVYVIEAAKAPAATDALSVRQQVVKLGASRGDKVAVLSGLHAGDRVATSGAFKLRPGALVRVDDSISTGNSESPTPADT